MLELGLSFLCDLSECITGRQCLPRQRVVKGIGKVAPCMTFALEHVGFCCISLGPALPDSLIKTSSQASRFVGLCTHSHFWVAVSLLRGQSASLLHIDKRMKDCGRQCRIT